MEPITGLNLVFYVGNFLADLAIALFAIKSGYIEKKYNAIKNEYEDLITIYNLIKIVIEDMDNKKFDIIDNLSFKTTKDLGLFDDYMAEYNYYEYDLRS